MKKVACLIYPNFSLYEIVDLTSALVLSFDITIDYIASKKETIISEDGLLCQPTKILDDVDIEEYSCIILPGMTNFTPALRDEKIIRFLASIKTADILIAAISSAPILLAKAGLLENYNFTGGIWQNFLDYFDFISKDNFKPKAVYQDGKIITAIGFAHQEFARMVLLALKLTDDASSYFKEPTDYGKDCIFQLTEDEFNEFKLEFELTAEHLNNQKRN